MKKIKVLAALCLSVAAIGAASATVLAAPATTAENIQLFENLGFSLPQKSSDTDYVTRGEFVHALTQFVSRDLYPNGQYSFTDVPKDSEISGGLMYAVANGMVSDGETFDPDRTITYNEAMKMAVVFIGRGVEAERAGGYPSGYLSVGSTQGLLADLKDTADGQLTVRDFYTLLNNIGQADTLFVNSNNDIYEGDTVFEAYFNMYEVKGIVTSDEYTSLDSTNGAGKGKLKIGDSVYTYSGTAPVGHSVEGWARNINGDTDAIVMIKDYRTSTFSVSLSDVDGKVSGNKFYYSDGNKSKYVTLENANVLYNGVYVSGYNLGSVNSTMLGTIEFVDNDDDGSYEVVNIAEYTVGEVQAVNTTDSKVVLKVGSAVELDKDGVVKKYTVIKNGAEIELSELASGDVIQVYSSKNDKVKSIKVATGTVSGTLDSYSSSTRDIKIDGTTYKFSSYFDSNYKRKLVYGNAITAITSDDGIIHALTDASAAGSKYGYTIKWWKSEDGEEINVRLCDENGKVQTYTMGDKVKYNGTTRKDIENVLDDIRTTNDMGTVFQRFIRYKANSNNEITLIDTPSTSKGRLLVDDPNYDADDCMIEYAFPSFVPNSPFYVKDVQAFMPYVRFTGSTKVFVCPDPVTSTFASDEDYCYLKDVSYMVDARTLGQLNYDSANNRRPYKIFDVDEYGVAGMIVIYATPSKTIGTSSSKAVLYSAQETITNDGEMVYKLIVFEKGEFKTYLTDEDYYNSFSSTNSFNLDRGDFIGFNVDSVTGRVNNAEVMYDYSAKTWLNTNFFSTQAINKSDLFTGKAKYVSESGMTIDEQLMVYGECSFAMGDASIYVVDDGGMNIYEGDVSDIETIDQVGSDKASMIVADFVDGYTQQVIVYK